MVKHCDLIVGGIDDSEKVLGIKVNENESQDDIFSNWAKAFPILKNIVTTNE